MSVLGGVALFVSVVVAAAQSAAGAPGVVQVVSWSGVIAIAGVAVQWGSLKASQKALKEATGKSLDDMGERVNRVEDRIEARLARIESKIDNLGG